MRYTTEEFKQVMQLCDAAMVVEAYLQRGHELGIEMKIAGSPNGAITLLGNLCSQVWKQYSKAMDIPLNEDSFLTFMTNVTETAAKAINSNSGQDETTISELKRS